MSEDTKQDFDRIDRMAEQLMEHYDSVSIFVSRSDGAKDKTRYFCRGSGNWFARYGQIVDWLKAEDARTAVRVKKEEAERDAP